MGAWPAFPSSQLGLTLCWCRRPGTASAPARIGSPAAAIPLGDGGTRRGPHHGVPEHRLQDQRSWVLPAPWVAPVPRSVPQSPGGSYSPLSWLLSPEIRGSPCCSLPMLAPWGLCTARWAASLSLGDSGDGGGDALGVSKAHQGDPRRRHSWLCPTGLAPLSTPSALLMTLLISTGWAEDQPSPATPS